jgi:hypothetical protein
MAEVLRGKALAHVLDHAKITDASGNEVNLSELDEQTGLEDVELGDEALGDGGPSDTELAGAGADDTDEADGAAFAEDVEAVGEISGGAEVGDAGSTEGDPEGDTDEAVPGPRS